MAKESEVEGWVSVYSTSTDYEADMVRDRLDSSGIPAVVLTQRDHAFNLTVGTLATVHVMVPPDHAGRAQYLIREEIFTDDELNRASEMAPRSDPDRKPTEAEQLLDSGNEELHFSPPEEEEEDEEDDEKP